MSIEVMKQALEYLQDNQHYIADNERHEYVMEYNAFIERFEKVIEQAEKQEPVWAGMDLDGMVEAFHRVIEEHCTTKSPFHNPVNADALGALRGLRGLVLDMKRYTSPPSNSMNSIKSDKTSDAPRQPLTDDEIEELMDTYDVASIDYARAIEAAHGIKGEA